MSNDEYDKGLILNKSNQKENKQKMIGKNCKLFISNTCASQISNHTKDKLNGLL